MLTKSSATTLVFQSALPALLFAPHETSLILRGGTNVSKSPSIDYTRLILLPFLKTHFGVQSEIEIRKRGLPASGGGELYITVKPLEHKLGCVSLRERGDVTSFHGIMWAAREEHKSVLSLLSLLMIDNGSIYTFDQSRTQKDIP
jgi:RNA 3'-terminal phosphate cyclase (ATP)